MEQSSWIFPDEPSCNGKRLGQWLETRIEGGGDFTPAAKDAIHQMGTNAICVESDHHPNRHRTSTGTKTNFGRNSATARSSPAKSRRHETK